jgi:lactoylglutathione lyase
MLKFPNEEVATLELVHRPAEDPVEIGTGFSHLVVRSTISPPGRVTAACGLAAWSRAASG